MWDNQSRWEAARQLLGEAQVDLDELAEEIQIKIYGFSRDVTESPDLTNEPEGEQSALGDALIEVVDQNADQRLAGVVLLSDGSNTSGIGPMSAARQLRGRAPVFAFGFGRETTTDTVRDVFADNIIPDSEVVFVKNRLTVKGMFTASGFADQAVPVRLKLDGVEKARGVLNVRSGEAQTSIDLSAIPENSGDVKVTLEADVLDGELLPDNNQMSTYVTVLPGGLSVLYVEGKYRFWEPKFIRWAVDESPDIELSQIFVLAPSGRPNEIPNDLFQRQKFDVVILGDVSADQLRLYHEQVAEMVRRGSGLMMIGGYDSFGPGGWGDTPLQDILPVRMTRSDGQFDEKTPFLPRDERHFILRLASTYEESQRIWKSLPPLDGGSRFAGLKRNALVLAEGPSNEPLLVAAPDVGAGRVLAMAGDTTWRWRSTEKGAEVHSRFWRQLILWLARRDEDKDAKINVSLDKRRLALGETLPLRVTVRQADGTPVPDTTVKAVVLAPDGSELPLELYPQGGAYRGNFLDTQTAGDYSITVSATSRGKDLGRTSSKFLVYEQNNEMRQLAAELDVLRNVAEITSGEYNSNEELPNFIRSLQDRDLNLKVTQPIYENLWDRWEVLIVFLGVVAAEWIIRKRHGMV